MLHGQTDYTEDSRSQEIREVVIASVELGNLCGRHFLAEEFSAARYDSILQAAADVRAQLKSFEYSSRYRPLLGMCNFLFLDRLALVYDKQGDSIMAYAMFREQMDWIAETYKSELYPIIIVGSMEGYQSDYSISEMYEPVSWALRNLAVVANRFDDSKTLLDAIRLFMELGLKSEVSDRRTMYAMACVALDDLHATVDERKEWMMKAVYYFKSSNVRKTDWLWNGYDMSAAFYNLLKELRKVGKSVSTEDLMLAAVMQRDMNRSTLEDEIYQLVLNEQGLLSFDVGIDIYDYYYPLGRKAEAKRALQRLNVQNLGCVDLSVVAARYRQLGEDALAKEFDKKYKKCMQEHKQFERWRRRQDRPDVFGWVPDFWDEKMNLALSVNPLAGLNTKMGTAGSAFKFIPMSADLRTGAFLHEFRWNKFLDYNGSERFTRGNLGKVSIENEIFNEWKSLRGNDFSYYLGIIAHRTEDEGYDERWKGYHAFGVQYLWGQFQAKEEVASVLFKNNTMPQDVRIVPQIYRHEWLVQWKYSRFYKGIFYYTLFTGVGAGQRSLEYNSPDAGISEAQLRSATESSFFDQRLVQSNWVGYKLSFRAGFRVGITLK